MNSIKKHAELLIEVYQKKLSHYSVGAVQERAYNFEFTVQNSKDKIKVQVYFGKKGVKTVLQGNPNSPFYFEIENKLNGQQSLSFEKSVPRDDIEPEDYIGADESGKGDFFGPLVTAAVYVNKNDIVELKKMRVVDSKLLSDFQIRNIAEKVKTLLADKFVISSLIPAKYNKVYEEKKNLNKLLREEHQQNIYSLLKKCNTNNIIIDSFEKKAFSINGNVKIFQTEKAERYTGVAAASILARAEMVNWFDNNFINDNIELPKGSSTHLNDFLKKINFSSIINWANFCKLHFKNYQNIKR